MSSRRNIRYFLVFTLLFWTIGPLMVYVIDPYHIFHETRWNKNLWFGSQTLINSSQIESYLKRSNDYDGILLGSSHTMNFKGSDLAKAAGAKGVLKLCGNGMTLKEIQTYYTIALNRSRRISRVIIGVDCHNLFRIDNFIKNNIFVIKHPYLYPLTLRGLLSIPTRSLLHLLRYIAPNNEKFWYWSDLDSVHNWFLYQSDSFQQWIQVSNLRKLKRNAPDFNNFTLLNDLSIQSLNNFTIQQLNESILRIVRESPSVNFYVLLTPNAWTLYEAMELVMHTYFPNTMCSSDQMYNVLFNGWRHLVTACADLPNVKIYGWHDCAFVSNLANSCDSDHYHPDINRYMAWCIEHDKHRLTKDNYDAYEARCVESLRAFKILDAYPHRDTFDELVAAEY